MEFWNGLEKWDVLVLIDMSERKEIRRNQGKVIKVQYKYIQYGH